MLPFGDSERILGQKEKNFRIGAIASGGIGALRVFSWEKAFLLSFFRKNERI